jgi:hypothetical protein
MPETNMTTAMGATTSSTASEAATGGPASGVPSSPPQMAAATALVGTDDNTIGEAEVIMGQLGLKVSGDVSLTEAMGTTHFALNQVHDVLRREREDIDEEQLRLSLWGSQLKKWMASEKEKAGAR